MAYHHRTVAWINLKDGIKARFKLGLIMLPVLAVIAFAIHSWLKPRHEGKTAEEWILELANAPATAEVSLRNMGEAAVPAIERMLNAQDSALKDRLRSLTKSLPKGLQLFPVPADEERRLAALAFCAFYNRPESFLPVAIEHFASDEGIEGLDSFVSGRHGYSARSAPRIKGSSEDWIKTGPGIMSTNRNLTLFLAGYKPRDFLTIFCADASTLSLPALLDAASEESGNRRRRLTISFAHTFRALGTFPQPQAHPWNDVRVILNPRWLGTQAEQVSLGGRLLAFTSDEDEIVRASAIYALGVMLGCGAEIPEAKKEFAAAAKDEANIVRTRFAQAVANMPFETDGFLHLASGLTTDPAADVRNAVESAMQFHLMKSRIRFEDLKPLLTHENNVIRFEAVRGLGNCPEGPEITIPALLEQSEKASGNDWNAILSAFRHLSEDHKQECISALTGAIRHDSLPVRVLAARCLAAIDWESRSTQIFVVHAIGKPEVLYNENPQIVRHALLALSMLGPRAAAEGIPVLTKFLTNRTMKDNRGLGIVALAKLGKNEPEKIIPVIAELLSDSDSNAVAGAILSCEILGSAANRLLPELKQLRADKRDYDAHSISSARERKPIRDLASKAVRLVSASN